MFPFKFCVILFKSTLMKRIIKSNYFIVMVDFINCDLIWCCDIPFSFSIVEIQGNKMKLYFIVF